jgi:hypothetical protein
MPTAIDRYREILRTKDWGRTSRRSRGFPDRGNLELAHAAAQEGSKEFFVRVAALDVDHAPENTPEVFLVFCGVLGLGRILAEGDDKQEAALRRLAGDARWRVREAVATGLQTVGDASLQRLHQIARAWLRLGWLEQRAAVAAVAEPRLLTARTSVSSALRILDRATRNLAKGGAGGKNDRLVLRQALGYAWSVVVVAAPNEGKAAMEAWFDSDNPDVQWLMRENLRKARLKRLDPKWCAASEKRLRSLG